MSEADLSETLDACKPTRVMKIGNYTPASPQENANAAWARLGEKMGFQSMTVRAVDGKGHRFFTAVGIESTEDKRERLERDAAEQKAQEIELLQHEIGERQERLTKLSE